MHNKTGNTKMIVYFLVGALVLAILIAAAVYLPDLMRQLHGG